jgi:hypothetical protein
MGNIAEWLPSNDALIALATAAFLYAAILAVGLWTGRRRPSVLPFEPDVVSDWRPTGQIDFVSTDDVMRAENGDTPAPFNLLTQEQRLVANIAGHPTGEVRWRYATKDEVKDVMRRVAMTRREGSSEVGL